MKIVYIKFIATHDDEIVKYINSKVEEIINLTPRKTAEDLIND